MLQTTQKYLQKRVGKNQLTFRVVRRETEGQCGEFRNNSHACQSPVRHHRSNKFVRVFLQRIHKNLNSENAGPQQKACLLLL